MTGMPSVTQRSYAGVVVRACAAAWSVNRLLCVAVAWSGLRRRTLCGRATTPRGWGSEPHCDASPRPGLAKPEPHESSSIASAISSRREGPAWDRANIVRTVLSSGLPVYDITLSIDRCIDRTAIW